MASIGERVTALRERRPGFDHLLRMLAHYGSTKGNLHAGAVTYFAFLSFFPLLALAFFAVGQISAVYPAANDQLRVFLTDTFPGIIGTGPNEISLDDVRSFSGLAAVVGVAGVLYTGLGFIQALREALTYVFEQPDPKRSFVAAKASDLVALATVGGTLILSVAVGAVLTRFSSGLLGLVGLDDNLAWLLALLAVVVALGINAVLFFMMFRQLGGTDTPARSLWSGALLAAVGFEALKQLSTTVIASTQGNPAFQAFGTALVLIVWINYFGRLTFYAASWAHTSARARAMRSDEAPPVQGPQLPNLRQVSTLVGASDADLAGVGRARRWAAPFVTGGAAMLALVAVLRRKAP